MFGIREIKNKAEYNPLLISKQAPFTQAWFYGQWQEMMGRKVRRFMIIRPRRTSLGLEKDSEIIGFFQAVIYPLIFSKRFIYIPHGPILKTSGFSDKLFSGAPDFLPFFKDELFQIAKKEKAVFVRFDFWPNSELGLGKYFKRIPDYVYHSAYFQPKYEWLLDLDKSESELLNNIDRKNRYDIRSAENRGVMVEIIENNFEKYFEDFFNLMEKTARRNNFKLHPRIYYENIFSALDGSAAFLALAKYHDEIFAVNFVLLFGEVVYVVFGGSNDEFKNLRAPRLLHWRGIVAAKNRGYKFYNFGAVSAGGDYKSLEGISKFKKGFGGRLLEYFDSYDLVLKPFWHWLYNLRKLILNK